MEAVRCQIGEIWEEADCWQPRNLEVEGLVRWQSEAVEASEQHHSWREQNIVKVVPCEGIHLHSSSPGTGWKTPPWPGWPGQRRGQRGSLTLAWRCWRSRRDTGSWSAPGTTPAGGEQTGWWRGQEGRPLPPECWGAAGECPALSLHSPQTGGWRVGLRLSRSGRRGPRCQLRPPPAGRYN